MCYKKLFLESIFRLILVESRYRFDNKLSKLLDGLYVSALFDYWYPDIIYRQINFRVKSGGQSNEIIQVNRIHVSPFFPKIHKTIWIRVVGDQVNRIFIQFFYHESIVWFSNQKFCQNIYIFWLLTKFPCTNISILKLQWSIKIQILQKAYLLQRKNSYYLPLRTSHYSVYYHNNLFVVQDYKFVTVVMKKFTRFFVIAGFQVLFEIQFVMLLYSIKMFKIGSIFMFLQHPKKRVFFRCSILLFFYHQQ